MNRETFEQRINELSHVRFLSREDKHYITDYKGSTIIIHIMNDASESPIQIMYKDLLFCDIDHIEIDDDEGAIYDINGNRLAFINTSNTVFTLDYNQELSKDAIVYDLNSVDISYIDNHCIGLGSKEEEDSSGIFPIIDELSITPVNIGWPNTFEGVLKCRASAIDLRPLTFYREISHDIAYLQSRLYSSIYSLKSNTYNLTTLGYIGFLFKFEDDDVKLYNTIKEPEYLVCINALDKNDIMRVNYMNLIDSDPRDKIMMLNEETLIAVSTDHTDVEAPIRYFYKDYILPEENRDKICGLISDVCKIFMKYFTDIINRDYSNISYEDLFILDSAYHTLDSPDTEDLDSVFFKCEKYVIRVEQILHDICNNYRLGLEENDEIEE